MKKSLLLLISYLFILVQSASAEFLCSADVGYFLKKDAEQTDKMSFVVETLYGRGDTEALAKQNLERLVPRALKTAKQLCLSKHENITDCVLKKIAQKSNVLSTLDFQLRRELEKGYKEDCEKASGKCEDSFVTELTCRKLIEPEPEENKKASGKDKKGAKGKKDTK